MVTFPVRRALANTPTPLEEVHVLGGHGPRIWIKRDDLTGSGLSGNKVRKLEFVAAHAIENGVDTLITCGGLQSNHCRATALVGAQLGLSVHLLLRAEGNQAIDGNYFIDHLAGATVEVIPKKDYLVGLEARLEQCRAQYAKQGKVAHVIPTGASDEIGIWGYVHCAKELSNDFQRLGINPEVIVCATGSGGTQAGLSLGGHLFNLSSQVIGYAVCDSQAYFDAKVFADIQKCVSTYSVDVDPNLISIQSRDQYIGPGYAKGFPELFDCIKTVASNTGILLDPVYTGKAFYGLLQDIQKGVYDDVEDIVFIHTGGVFGLFAQKSEFDFPIHNP